MEFSGTFVFWFSVFLASIFTSLGFLVGGMMAAAKRADEQMEAEQDYLRYENWRRENGYAA